MFETISSISGFCLFLDIAVLIAVAYHLILRYWFYFSDRNVKFIRGAPFLGSAYKSVLGIEPVAISYRRCYERFPTERFCGTYKFGGRPHYLIRGPDLIKQILGSDCDHFDNVNDLCAYTFGTQKSAMDPALFLECGMKMLHLSMVKYSDDFVRTVKETDKITKLFDSYELFTCYATDIVAVAIFGIELNSLRDADNDLLKASRLLTNFRHIDSLKFLLSSRFPSILKFSNTKYADWLKKIVENSGVSNGEKSNSFANNNMFSLLKKARDNELSFDKTADNINIGFAATQESSNVHDNKIQSLTDADIVEQCLQLFIGNMKTISTTACFMFHELAMNPDIQNKLFTEINDIKTQLDGSPLTYQMIPQMPYLDMVICETLRRWPTHPFLERICKRPYVLVNSNDTTVELQMGDSVCIPTYALHMDTKYFPKPNKFDPERFNDANRQLIRAGTYFPFGFGPYNCVGSRFTLLAIKTLTFHLLSEFYIDKSYKTQDPLQLKALPLQMNAENGFFVELRRRQPDRTPYKSQVFT